MPNLLPEDGLLMLKQAEVKQMLNIMVTCMSAFVGIYLTQYK